MDHDNVLIFFSAVVTLAVLLQAGAMVGMWLAIRKIPSRLDGIRSDFKQRIDPLTQSITEIVTNTRVPLHTITSNLVAITETLRERSIQVDTVVEDLVEKSRIQIVRTDQLMANLVDKVEVTTDKIQQAILTPLHEISAVVKGLQTGLEFLFNRKRPAGGREATADEQLFI
jgi:ABC-type transporter Mla subunit MlaD